MCKLRGLAPTPTQLPQLLDNTPHYIHPIDVELSHHPASTVHLHYLVILANSPNSSTLFRIYFSDAASNFGPSGVGALPLAAGRNEGGRYFNYIFAGI